MTLRHRPTAANLAAIPALALAISVLILAPGASPALAAPPEPPEVTVDTPVPATTATLHGTLNPALEGETGTYRFLYAAGGSCEGGSETASGLALGAKPEVLPAESITGLTPNTEYTVCLLDEVSPTEKTLSPPLTFITALTPETPEALTPEPIGTTTATLKGVLNPKQPGDAGTFEFAYRENPTECQGSGEKLTVAQPATGEQAEPVTAEVTGLLPNATYTACLLAHDEAAEASAPSAPVTFTTSPVKPTVASEEATSITESSAILTAKVNPNGAEVAACVFESGTEAGVYPTKVACAPPPGSVRTPVAVSAAISELHPNVTYHWRILVTNAAGAVTSVDHTFIDQVGSPAEASCAGLPEPLRHQTEQVRGERNSTGLPDCRAYEMVTPPQKNGALIGVTYMDVFASRPVIAADGQRVIAPSIQCFAEPQSCVGFRESEGEPFAFTRTIDGWRTTPLALPAASFETGTYLGVSADAGTALFSAPSEPGSEVDDFYALDTEGSPVRIGPLGDVAEHSNWAVLKQEGMLSTADLSHFVYETKDGPAWSFDEGEGNGVYEYAGVGRAAPLMVGVTGPMGSDALVSSCRTSRGGSSFTQKLYGPLSADGRTVFFTAAACLSGTGSNASIPVPADTLYARIDGEEESRARSVRISAPTPGTCETKECEENTGAEKQAERARQAGFEGASTDGSRVFFTSTQQLTDAASESSKTVGGCNTNSGPGGCNLYESVCEECEEVGESEEHARRRLIDVSEGAKEHGGPRVQGVLAMSADGSHVYFVAEGKLTGEEENQSHEKAQEKADNLYVYSAGHVAFITILSPSDGPEWQPGNLQANVTPDGRFLVFTSHRALTADATCPETEGETPVCPAQVFEYDAQTRALVRISVGEGGFNDDGNQGALGPLFPATGGHAGDANIVPVATAADAETAPVRSDPTMSNDGAFVFFQSPLALTAGALNDVPVGDEQFAQNVYEYHQGHVYLISDGKDTSPEGKVPGFSPVELLGSDTSGSNVFFTTFDRLVPEDTDTQRDIYDAHICSVGSACPPPVPAATAPCDGEACHGPAPGVSAGQVPGSESFSGPGNLTPTAPAAPKPKTAAQIRAEKLAKALKACRKDKRKKKRQACEKAAHQAYGAKKASRSSGARRAGADRSRRS